ncbi:unnamed protein product, partial [Ectocarpus sp. 8 AP-2014]
STPAAPAAPPAARSRRRCSSPRTRRTRSSSGGGGGRAATADFWGHRGWMRRGWTPPLLASAAAAELVDGIRAGIPRRQRDPAPAEKVSKHRLLAEGQACGL